MGSAQGSDDMTPEEFINRAADQQPVAVQQTVYVQGPQLRTLLAEGKPILLSDLMAHPDQHPELRTFRYVHLLGAGISANAVDAWQDKHPAHPLPADLREFLTRVNGVHLWADLASSRAYFGILPLDEWEDAASVDWAMMFDSPPVGQLVISYHDNGDDYLVLDTAGPEYLWYTLEDFDNPKRIGRTVPELLDFWWQETNWLDPRKESGTALGQ